MDATRLLRPMFACSAGLMFLATAVAAGPPCEGDACDAAGGCVGLDECEGGCCTAESHCGCLTGGKCSCGPGCACGSGRRSGGRFGWWGRRGDGDDPDTGLIGAEQKCHNGKLWPPYPRPHENADYCTQFHANHYWPHPYDCWDQAWVKNILAIQTANGWAQATTLCAAHFDPETHCLNDTGRLHLRWILHNVPAQFRTVYVEAGDRHVSDTRRTSVESEAAVLAGSAAAPIVVRPVMIPGRPAVEVDAIRRAELSTQPSPRLRVTDLGTGAGDDGAG
ncbi:MAG TPA: hypothetical protein VF170_02850, partial [Planctomycetaceae bacterium]